MCAVEDFDCNERRITGKANTNWWSAVVCVCLIHLHTQNKPHRKIVTGTLNCSLPRYKDTSRDTSSIRLLTGRERQDKKRQYFSVAAEDHIETFIPSHLRFAQSSFCQANGGIRRLFLSLSCFHSFNRMKKRWTHHCFTRQEAGRHPMVSFSPSLSNLL